MTNYNERLNEIIRKIRGDDYGPMNYGSYDDAKQAITSLNRELVTEAKPKTTPYNNLDGGYATDIRSNAINEFEQNLLKALEEA